MNNLIQIFFEEVMCYVDIEKEIIYSAKLKPLKPQKLKRHLQPYYMIKYDNKKAYKPKSFLLRLANEKRDSQARQVL